MENMVKDLHEMCDTLARALKEANEKLRNAGGKVSATDLEYINRLTHSLKSIKATIAMIEAEEDDGYGLFRKWNPAKRIEFDSFEPSRKVGLFSCVPTVCMV